MKTQRIFLLSACITLLILFFAWIDQGTASPIVVGYYPSWFKSTFPAQKIQFNNLTCIVHAFAWPNADGSISPSPLGDLDDPRLIDETHKAQKKILIALGGWGHSDGFSPMVKDSTTRKKFIANITDFCSLHQYDGIDLDWEYPASSTDGSNLNLFVHELRAALDRLNPALLLTMAVPAGPNHGDLFDYATLKKDIDWFGCMTYDFFGSWINRAGHNAPLYPPAQNNNGSVQSGIQYLISQRNVPKEKVLSGIPFYGHGCSASGLNAIYTGGTGDFRYSEIQSMMGTGWTYFWDEAAKVPYLLNASRTYFITFDDTLSVRFKCEYAINNDLAGVMIWALGQDDLGLHQPLLETVGKTLGRTTAAVRRVLNGSPENMVLSQNYPNPFNGRTVIPFYAPKDGRMRIAISNSLGECVAVLFDEWETAGWHQAVFRSDGFASGVYLYSLSGPSFSQTRKMAIAQ